MCLIGSAAGLTAGRVRREPVSATRVPWKGQTQRVRAPEHPNSSAFLNTISLWLLRI